MICSLLAQICHFFPQENAALQTSGFGCFRSSNLGVAPQTPALSAPLFQDPQTPSCSHKPPPGWFPLSPGAGFWLQLEDQSVQMEQLRRELDARRDELDQAQSSLSHAKQVPGEHPNPR